MDSQTKQNLEAVLWSMKQAEVLFWKKMETGD